MSDAVTRVPWMKHSTTAKGSPDRTANDPRTGNDPQIGPQMILGSEMNPKLIRKLSLDGKRSPDWIANDPRSPHHKYRMEWTQIWTVDLNFNNTSRCI